MLHCYWVSDVEVTQYPDRPALIAVEVGRQMNEAGFVREGPLQVQYRKAICLSLRSLSGRPRYVQDLMLRHNALSDLDGLPCISADRSIISSHPSENTQVFGPEQPGIPRFPIYLATSPPSMYEVLCTEFDSLLGSIPPVVRIVLYRGTRVGGIPEYHATRGRFLTIRGGSSLLGDASFLAERNYKQGISVRLAKLAPGLADPPHLIPTAKITEHTRGMYMHLAPRLTWGDGQAM
ncbi:hypothetical protein CLAIMM_15115 isoform 2 [Cladophialophora immunda]|nr:hypothetical protein CLAIMM_15115 isoform 2 [Cladophialophora immunda]